MRERDVIEIGYCPIDFQFNRPRCQSHGVRTLFLT